MGEPLVKQQDVQKGAQDVLKIFDMQIRREMDYVRAKAYWERTLQELPLAVLSEALAQFSYDPGCVKTR